jgi:hypothetical protein
MPAARLIDYRRAVVVDTASIFLLSEEPTSSATAPGITNFNKTAQHLTYQQLLI